MPEFADDARLSGAFAQFRDEVAPYVAPPGTAAAHHWVRRRRRVGAAAITAGAVLFVGGPAVGFAAANNDTPTPPPVVPTELPTPGPTFEPTPAPTAAPPVPTGTSAPPTRTPGVPRVSGKVFYTDERGALYLNGRQYPGGNNANVTVSPDGKRVMWVEQPDPGSGDPGGDLMLSDLDGGNRRLAFPRAEWLCQEPVWSGDSTRLLVTSYTPAGAGMGVVYLAGGAGDHLGKPKGCHYRWSADGKRVAYQHGDVRGVTVHDLYGGNEVTLDRDDVGGRFYVGLNSISADGDRICVSLQGPDATGGDAGRNLGCDKIMDVSAKKVVKMPFEGELTSAVFVADGGMLARVKTDKGSELLRLDADDRVIARSVESSANTKRKLLSYTP